MLIEELDRSDLRSLLRSDGIALDMGAFTVRVGSSIDPLVDRIADMYGAYRVDEAGGINDAVVTLREPRRWPGRKPRIVATIDDERDLDAHPEAGYHAAFESALNWAIATSELSPLLLHAAVVERDGRAVIVPAASGSGKSTLCAALIASGWRLFSDEMAIFRTGDGALLPSPRPVSLKNASIDLIRGRDPQAYIGPVARGTPRGDIAYMRAPRDAVLRCEEPAVPGLVLRPQYRPGADTSIARLSRVEAFRLLTENAVNYSPMQRYGFDILTGVAERCAGYEITYSDLDDAIELIAEVHRAAA